MTNPIFALMGINEEDEPVLLGLFLKEEDAIEAWAAETANARSKYTGVTYHKAVPE